jgi:hypothetical protein
MRCEAGLKRNADQLGHRRCSELNFYLAAIIRNCLVANPDRVGDL